jgi:histidine ammonia-lyase
VLGGAQAARAGIEPVALAAKDGLALISSNAATVGHAAMVLVDCARALNQLNVAAALTFEGFRASESTRSARATRVPRAAKPSWRALRALLDGSALNAPGAARRVRTDLAVA